MMNEYNVSETYINVLFSKWRTWKWTSRIVQGKDGKYSFEGSRHPYSSVVGNTREEVVEKIEKILREELSTQDLAYVDRILLELWGNI